MVLDTPSNLGITRNYQRAFASCTTDYVAVLEGDDYWSSPQKLRRQREFLDQQPQCPMCAVNFMVYEEAIGRFTPRTAPGPGTRMLSAADQIADNVAANFSTFMCRLSALRALPPRLFEITAYDWIISICLARMGPIGFIEEPMSVYRLHPGGVWTGATILDQLKTQLDIIPGYDALTDRTLHDEFSALAARLQTAIAACEGAEVAPSRDRPDEDTWAAVKTRVRRLVRARPQDDGGGS
jgi:glycosyltransferase involved in cell wall biosynthesis